MRKLKMRNGVWSKLLADLLLLCLVGACLIILTGCGKLPEYPETLQCTFSHARGLFFCVNTKTKAKVRLRADSPRMSGAQCVSLDDYRKGDDWVKSVIAIAERRCR